MSRHCFGVAKRQRVSKGRGGPRKTGPVSVMGPGLAPRARPGMTAEKRVRAPG